jgi:hypothetical protein
LEPRRGGQPLHARSHRDQNRMKLEQAVAHEFVDCAPSRNRDLTTAIARSKSRSEQDEIGARRQPGARVEIEIRTG